VTGWVRGHKIAVIVAMGFIGLGGLEIRLLTWNAPPLALIVALVLFPVGYGAVVLGGLWLSKPPPG
jgi:hypothetical protein